MPDDDQYENHDVDEFDDDEQAEILKAFRRLNNIITHGSWFHKLGQPLDDQTRVLAEDFLAALGFPDAHVAQVQDWEHAAIAAENPDINAEGWEAEEQLRAFLATEATAYMGEDDLNGALEAITQTARKVMLEAASEAASMWGVDDQAIVDAAAGQAIQTCFNAALVLAAREEVGHPFTLLFQIYEQGYWPIGLAGRTYNIF